MTARRLSISWAVALISGIALSSVVNSHDHGHHDHDDDQRQLGAHVHGVATMTIAQDGEDFVVELNTPSINVVSFEHLPTTDAHRTELERALALLKDASNVLQLTRAGACELDDIQVESDQLTAMGYNRHGTKDEHGHDDHGHDDHGHDDHGHDDHGHDDHGHDEGHSDFVVEYTFHCDEPSRVIGAHLPVFEAFPSFETIDVQWIVGQRNARRVFILKVGGDYQVIDIEAVVPPAQLADGQIEIAVPIHIAPGHTRSALCFRRRPEPEELAAAIDIDLIDFTVVANGQIEIAVVVPIAPI